MFLNKHKFNALTGAAEQKESAMNEATRRYFSSLANGQPLKRYKQPEADLKSQSRRVMEISFAITLTVLIVLFQVSRHFSLNVASVDNVKIQIEVADIPVTEQHRLPPPPVRPSVPVPSEEESIPEDLTIASTDLDLSEIPPPPEPPADDMEIFVAYDEAPEIIGGLAALAKNLKYPRLAQAANIEGTVIVRVLVSAGGNVERVEVLRAKPENMGFEKSATEALMKVKWKPAKQRDRKIRVWVSVPVQFKLINS